MAQENSKFFVKNIPLTDSITCVVQRPYLRNIGHLICIELLAYVSKCQESKMVLHVTSVRQLAKIAMLPVEITITVMV